MTGTNEGPVPFDRVEFRRLLGEVSRYLAELRHIDEALAYLAARDVAPGAGPGPNPGTIEIHLGRTYPFVATLRSYSAWNPATREAIQVHLDELYLEADRWATADITTLGERVRTLTTPRTRRYDRIVQDLEAVYFPLAALIKDDFGELRHTLGNWQGDAAENFASKFYHPFGKVLDNQAWLVDALAVMFERSKVITELSQHSLMNAVVATRDALLEQLQQRSEGNPGPSLKEVLIIGSAAAGVLAALTFSAPAAAAGFVAISSALGYAATQVPDSEDAERRTLTGASAEELAESMASAVSRILVNVGRQFGEVEDELKRLSDHLNSMRQADTLVPKRPYLTDGPTPSEFYHNTRDSAG
jgi:hypothetical protein